MVKTFCAIQKLDGVDIDQNVINTALTWMTSRQRADGAIIETNPVIHQEMDVCLVVRCFEILDVGLCGVLCCRLVVWCGMVYGVVWYGMVWYGMVWYGMVWYGMVWYGMVWYGMIVISTFKLSVPFLY